MKKGAGVAASRNRARKLFRAPKMKKGARGLEVELGTSKMAQGPQNEKGGQGAESGAGDIQEKIGLFQKGGLGAGIVSRACK